MRPGKRKQQCSQMADRFHLCKFDFSAMRQPRSVACCTQLRGVAYSGRSNYGHSFLLGKFDQLLRLVLWNSLSNDGDCTKLHSKSVP